MSKETQLTFTPEVVRRPFHCVGGLDTFDEVGGSRLPLVAGFTLVAVSRTHLKAIPRRGFSQIHRWNFRAQTSDFI